LKKALKYAVAYLSGRNIAILLHLPNPNYKKSTKTLKKHGN
jgi:hypothetical protein